MPVLSVKKLPSADAGRLLIRVHHSHRYGIERYGIAKFKNLENSKDTLALVLGHDENDAIFMPYDIRTKLGIEKGTQLSFEIETVGILSKLKWYVQSCDPAVYLPAWLAVISIILGFLSILLAAFT